MMALVQRSMNQDGPIGDPDGRVIRLVEGSWELCKKLRRSHLAVEAALLETADPSSNEVLDKCRDTCKETDGALKSVLETKKRVNFTNLFGVFQYDKVCISVWRSY